MMNWLRRLLANFVYKHVFNGVTEHDVLRGHAGTLYYRGTALNDKQINGIIQEARIIKETEVWKLVLNDIRASSNQKIFRSSTSMEEIASARAALWVTDVIERKVTTLAEMKFK